MNLKCISCGQLKPMGHYIESSSHPLSISGRIPVCIICLKDKIKDYKNLEEVSLMFQILDMGFFPEEWVSLAEEYNENPFIHYLNIYDQKGYSRKNKWKELNDIWQIKLGEGVAAASIPELKETHLLELRLKWRGDYSYQDYLWLERYSEKMKSQYAIETMDEEDKLMKIAKISLQIDMALDSGEPTKDLIASYDKLFASADFQAASSRDGSVTSISEVLEFMETKGFVPKYHFSTPKDIVDQTIVDLQEYYKRLVEGEPNLGDIVADKKQKRAERLGLKVETEEEQKFNAISTKTEEQKRLEEIKQAKINILDSSELKDEEEYIPGYEDQEEPFFKEGDFKDDKKLDDEAEQKRLQESKAELERLRAQIEKEEVKGSRKKKAGDDEKFEFNF